MTKLDPLVKSVRFKGEIEPKARDINTYVKPQEQQIAPPKGTTTLDSLALALRESSPVLQKYFKDKSDKEHEAEQAAGQKAQKELQLVEFSDAIRKNPEYETASPYFRLGYEKQAAVALSFEHNQYLNSIRQSDPTYLSITDPNEAVKYLQSKSADFIKSKEGVITSPEAQTLLYKAVDESLSYQDYNANSSKLDEMKQQKMDIFQTNILNGVSSQITEGKTPEQISALTSAFIQSAIIDGTPPSKVNDAAVESLITLMNNKSKEGDIKGAYSVKKVIEGLAGHDGTSISNIIRYRTALDTAWERLGDDSFKQIARDRQIKEWEKSDALQAVRDKYGADIWEKPTADRTKLLASVAKEYGIEVADELSTDIEKALGYQRSYKSFRKSEASGTGLSSGNSKSLKNSLLALSYQRPLTDSECSILAGTGATVQQVMNARQGKNVKNDGSVKDAADIAKKAIKISETEWGVKEYEKYRTLKGEILSDWSAYSTDFHQANRRLPSKFERDDYFETWLIKYKRKQAEDSKAARAEREVSSKVNPVIKKNNSSILFKSLPKNLKPDDLQRLIDESRKNKK